MICNVFRRKRRRGVKLQRDRAYTGRYRLDGDLVPTTIALGITDKRVAMDKLRQLVTDEEKRRAGLLLPIDQIAASSLPLSNHLDDFIKDLASRQKSKSHRYNIRHQVSGLIESCQWKLVRDVSAETFIAWRGCQTNKSPKTMNDYLDAISSLLNWMVDQRRLSLNPLAPVKRVDARGRHTFERDALTRDEFENLLRNAGGNRQVLYLVAVMTSLRRSTLHKLTWADVNLDDVHPSIHVRAVNNKNRQEQTSELREDVAAELRRLRPQGHKPTSRVFSRILPLRGTQFFKDDLNAAGIKREGNRRIDFHALRHTACTWAGNTGQGANVRLFSGHKTESQLNIYTHPSRAVARGVVAGLPRFDDVLAYLNRGTHIGTQATVADGQSVSQSVAVDEGEASSKNRKISGKTSRFQAENARHDEAGKKWSLPGSNR